MGRATDVPTGGRWYHVHCVPGGLRMDDTLAAEGPQSSEMSDIVNQQAARNRQGQPAERRDGAEGTDSMLQNEVRQLSLGPPAWGVRLLSHQGKI